MTRWSSKKINEWYSEQEWLIGSNFLPSTAINQLEMFQTETFDEKTIRKELGLAKSLRFNSMRVYLHDLLWDCLLYTSPSPRDQRGSRMPSSA